MASQRPWTEEDRQIAMPWVEKIKEAFSNPSSPGYQEIDDALTDAGEPLPEEGLRVLNELRDYASTPGPNQAVGEPSINFNAVAAAALFGIVGEGQWFVKIPMPPDTRPNQPQPTGPFYFIITSYARAAAGQAAVDEHAWIVIVLGPSTVAPGQSQPSGERGLINADNATMAALSAWSEKIRVLLPRLRAKVPEDLVPGGITEWDLSSAHLEWQRNAPGEHPRTPLTHSAWMLYHIFQQVQPRRRDLDPSPSSH